MMNRRIFLQTSGLASASMLIPGFLGALDRNAVFARGVNKLVVIQLSGGCDGLSMAVPYRNDLYYAARPQLAIPAGEVLRLDDATGFHPALEGFKALYDKGWMTLFNHVGYPNANRSHFRSMDIWQTGSNADEFWQSGWLGRYLDHACAGGCPAHLVVEMDDALSLALKGERYFGLAVRDLQKLARTIDSGGVREMQRLAPAGEGPEALKYMYKTLASTTQSVDYLQEKMRGNVAPASYPATDLGKQLRSIGSLIRGGSSTTVYYASQGGFDTHANQERTMPRLMEQLSGGVSALVKDLTAAGRMDETLILIFSEFGRRVAENGSRGTDHGSGNNLYLIGSRLKRPGIYNGPTDLSVLDDGDVRYKMDFREIYAALLSGWLGADDTKILKRAYKKPELV